MYCTPKVRHKNLALEVQFFMTKYSAETKMAVGQYYLEGKDSYKGTANRFGVNQTDVIKWVAAYKNHGTEGLTVKNGSYTGEFKLHVIKYMQAHGLSARSTAAKFNIPGFTTVCKWERIYLEEGTDALFRNNRGRSKKMNLKKKSKLNKQSTEDLIAEVQRIRMENEYLKKLNALIQEKERSATKIKHES